MSNAQFPHLPDGQAMFNFESGGLMIVLIAIFAKSKRQSPTFDYLSNLCSLISHLA
jgi:hypothetical protein